MKIEGSVSPTQLFNKVLLYLENNSGTENNIDVYNYQTSDFEKILFNDLLTNIFVIIENKRHNNLMSMGVDVCARVIIEICALLKAAERGHINDTQKKLFLLEYIYTDIKAKKPQNVDKEVLDRLYTRPYNKIISDIKELLGVDDKRAKEILEERRFFMRYGGVVVANTMLAFVKCTLGSEICAMREKINIFIHPCFYDKTNGIWKSDSESERETVINQVLTLGDMFIPEYPSEGYVKTKWNNQYVDVDTIALIKVIKKAFKDELKDPFKSKDPNDYYKDKKLADRVTRYTIFACFKKIGATLVDMLICESLGMRMQTLARQKCYAEMISVLGHFATVDNIDEVVKDFIFASDMSILFRKKERFHMFNKIDRHKKLTKEEEKMYDDYLEAMDNWHEDFKKHHGYPDTPEEFADKIRKQLLYYIKPDYNYKALVKDYSQKYVKQSDTYHMINNDYKLSAMLGHACTYKSKYKENKISYLIPNLIRYTIAVSEAYELFGLSDSLNGISDCIVGNIKQNKSDALDEKYKNWQ